jgi:CDGSH-type Zn-finger protein
MNQTLITPLDNGPLLVKGPVILQDAEGNPFPVDKPQVGLCRCGHSAKKPFCDGAHRGKFEDCCRVEK